MAVKFAGLISGALAAAIKQLVLAGLPTTHVLMFLFACLFMALPTAEKMAPLSCGAMSKRKETNKDAGKLRMHEYEKNRANEVQLTLSRSLRSIPGPRGFAPTRQAKSAPSKAT